MGRSRHSRLADEIRPPEDDFDASRARLICAEICRDLLGDLSPALALLPLGDRQRVQALAAHVRALSDFAGQPGLEGERLAQINRWEYEVDRALEGRSAGQPVFVAMAAEHLRRPWPVETLEALASTARSASIRGESPWLDKKVAAALCLALLGSAPGPDLEELAGRLLSCLVRRRRRITGGSSVEESPHAHHPLELVRRLNRIDRSATARRWRRALRFLCAVADGSCKPQQTAAAPLGFLSRARHLVRALLPG